MYIDKKTGEIKYVRSYLNKINSDECSDDEFLSELRHFMILGEEMKEEDDLYNQSWIKETDELDPWDQGFMMGYLGT